MKPKSKKTKPALVVEGPLKLDFGCGPNKREGFKGVDSIPFTGVDFVLDITQTPWPWADNSVDEAHASHFIEHLTAWERVSFVNELYRVLRPGATCQIIVPHWASCRAYGDPSHQWPPVGEFWFYYLDRGWREQNAPHTDIKHIPEGFACNFNATWGYSLHPGIVVKNQEYQQMAVQYYKEAVQDMMATLKKVE